MVRDKKNLEKIRNYATELEEMEHSNQRIDQAEHLLEGKEQSRKREVILFFSFDIVNSTAYKTINYFGWAQVLNRLFKKIRDRVYAQIGSAEMWRVLGDEIIFISKIRDEDELRSNVNSIFRIMINTISELKEGEFFEKHDSNYNLHRLQNILSLKAAAWIALIDDVGDISDMRILDSDVENIFEKYQSQEGNEIFEFLGNDIDTGFRVAKQTEDGRLILNYELAYLISRKTEDLSYLHIVTYKRLKGVWKDKLYPIIWYHDPKAYVKSEETIIQFEDSFTFDAFEESELIRDYYCNKLKIENPQQLMDPLMFADTKYALDKILYDRCLEKKVKRIQNQIKQVAYDQARYIDPENIGVHCVAVCFRITEDKKIAILVAKRQNQRKKMKGKWEFGCAKAVIDKSIAERIVEEYRQDFKINIRPVVDKDREIKEPIPIALYQVAHADDLRKMDKGIITLARIEDEYDVEAFEPTAKHERISWIFEEDLDTLEEKFKETVPDFKCTLIEAFKRIKERYNL